MKQKTIPQLMTEKQVAERTSLALSMIRKMRSCPARDPLPFYKIGKSVRYSEHDVAAWLERRRYYDDHQAKHLKDAG